MSDEAAAPPKQNPFLRGLKDKRVYMALAAALVLGFGAGQIAKKVLLEPKRRLAALRLDTLNDLTTLYGLQLAHFRAKGVYANDLDSLLALAKDGAALRQRMGAHMDLHTITVVGDDKRFKLEANVLDAERTLIKLKGPPMPRPRRAAPAAPQPLPTDEP